MASLKLLGFFSEIPHIVEPTGSLAELLSDHPQEHEVELASYLEHGVLLAGVTAVAADVLDPSRPPIGPMHILTDGEWAWPQFLAYYVRKYHVQLPANFVAHSRSLNWSPPAATRVDVKQLILPRRSGGKPMSPN